jgi:hypothetical protein
MTAAPPALEQLSAAFSAPQKWLSRRRRVLRKSNLGKIGIAWMEHGGAYPLSGAVSAKKYRGGPQRWEKIKYSGEKCVSGCATESSAARPY